MGRKNDFPHNLRRLMNKWGMPQSQLALRAGVSTASICKYLSGERKPKPETLRALAMCLGTSMKDLMGEEWKTFRDNTKSKYDKAHDELYKQELKEVHDFLGIKEETDDD